jgi:hypothetical protein
MFETRGLKLQRQFLTQTQREKSSNSNSIHKASHQLAIDVTKIGFGKAKIYTLCQFHQHFKSSVCADNLGQKKYKPNSWAQHFCTKNLGVKCWRN